MKWKILAGMALVIGFMYAVPSHAAVTLIYDDTLKDIQQTNNNPCVIGSPSCVNGALPFTTVPGGPGDQNLNSPTYTVSQLIGAVGSSAMNLLIDVNQSCGSISCPINLQLVEVIIAGTVEFVFNGPQNVPTSGSLSGNGFSDAGLKTIDLSKFASGATVVFHIVWNNQSDGQESFFLAKTGALNCEQLGNCPVPEPSALILLGSGLVVAVVLARRRFRRN